MRVEPIRSATSLCVQARRSRSCLRREGPGLEILFTASASLVPISSFLEWFHLPSDDIRYGPARAQTINHRSGVTKLMHECYLHDTIFACGSSSNEIGKGKYRFLTKSLVKRQKQYVFFGCTNVSTYFDVVGVEIEKSAMFVEQFVRKSKHSRSWYTYDKRGYLQ